MVKSVARFSGLSLICLIVTLTVPLIQCLPVEDQLNSNFQRFKRNVGFTPGGGSQSSSSANANSQSSSFGLTSNPLPVSYLNKALGGFKSLGGRGGGGGGVDSSDSDGLLSGVLQGLPFALGGTTKSLTGFLDNGVVSQLNDLLNGLLGGVFTGVNGFSTTIVPGLTNNLLSGGSGSGGGGGSKLPFGGGSSSLPFLLSQLGSLSSSKSQAQAQAGSQSIGLR